MNRADLPGIISSPRKPNIMQFLFTLSDEIDQSVMDHAMQKTIKRYPYFAFRIVKTEAGFDELLFRYGAECERAGVKLRKFRDVDAFVRDYLGEAGD